jgi:hypothetical protein
LIQMNSFSRFCILFCLSAIVLGAFAAAPGVHRQIVFLRLELDPQGVRLKGASVRPGVLKEPRSIPQPLVYRLLSETGTILHSGTLSDPRVRRIESFPRQGTPARHPILRTEAAEFSLRIPFHPEARRIEFFERAGGGGERPGGAKKREAVPVGKPLGGAAIPLLEE